MEKEIMSFADQEIANRLSKRHHFLTDVDQLINWKRILKVLNHVDLKRQSVAGRDSFSPEVMFRIMLIQSWYNLSDYQMEEQLFYNVRFLWFSHLSLENPVPDHSTICRWRGRFSEKGIYEKLFHEINTQLQKHSISIHAGAIVDATLVESHARPRKKVIIETEPVGDAEIPDQVTFQPTELKVIESADPDARWIKKGKKSTYGYKGHAVVDKEYGTVQGILVTPASKYDGHMLIPLIEEMGLPEGTEVLADKGYRSQDNERELEEKKLVSRIMQKKKKNQEMDIETADFNHRISTQRYKVERTFGCLKKHFGWGRSIYMGLKKTTDYLILGAIAFNLKRSLSIIRT